MYLSFVSGFIDSSQAFISKASAEVDLKPGLQLINQAKKF